MMLHSLAPTKNFHQSDFIYIQTREKKKYGNKMTFFIKTQSKGRGEERERCRWCWRMQGEGELAGWQWRMEIERGMEEMRDISMEQRKRWRFSFFF